MYLVVLLLYEREENDHLRQFVELISTEMSSAKAGICQKEKSLKYLSLRRDCDVGGTLKQHVKED